MHSRKELQTTSIIALNRVKAIFWIFVFSPIVFFVVFGPLSAEFVGKAYAAWVVGNIIIIGCRLIARGLNEHSPFLEYMENRIRGISGAVAYSHRLGVITWGDHMVWNVIAAAVLVGNIFLIPNLLTVPIMYIYMKVLNRKISKLNEYFEADPETEDSVIPSMLIPKIVFYCVAAAVVVALAGGAILIAITWYRKVIG